MALEEDRQLAEGCKDINYDQRFECPTPFQPAQVSFVCPRQV